MSQLLSFDNVINVRSVMFLMLLKIRYFLNKVKV